MTDRPDIDPGGPEDGGDDILAAEYALGLLEGADRRDFEVRLRREPALVAAVRAWEAHFAALAEDDVAETVPPPRVKAAVEAQLFGAPSQRLSLWNSVGIWRGLALAASVAAVVAVFAAVRSEMTPEPPVEGIPAGTILMSHLVPLEGSDLGLAVTREPGGALQIRRVAGGPSAGRAQEVWLVPDAEAQPISLGLLADEPLTTLRPPPEVSALFAAGATLAISEEPQGGSPTGVPTGPILAAGQLVPL
jgi:anti-sigma-K factor RskA